MLCSAIPQAVRRFPPTPYNASAAVSTLRGAKIASLCCSPAGLFAQAAKLRQSAASSRSRSRSTAAGGSALSWPYPAAGRACLRCRAGRRRFSSSECFARAGAMFTDTVANMDSFGAAAISRYRLVEATEQFAEEIVLAAFERGTSGPYWLEPHADRRVGSLQRRPCPKANISREERTTQRRARLELVEGRS